MNSILTGNSNDIKTAHTSKQKNDVETTGSIASNSYTPLFDVPVYNYDMFIPTNPFSLNIDFSSYANGGAEDLANNSTFMQGFANAMAALGEGSFSGGFAGAGCTSVASAGSCGSCSCGGGFIG
jgi:hypothetical protein